MVRRVAPGGGRFGYGWLINAAWTLMIIEAVAVPELAVMSVWPMSRPMIRPPEDPVGNRDYRTITTALQSWGQGDVKSGSVAMTSVPPTLTAVTTPVSESMLAVAG